MLLSFLLICFPKFTLACNKPMKSQDLFIYLVCFYIYTYIYQCLLLVFNLWVVSAFAVTRSSLIWHGCHLMNITGVAVSLLVFACSIMFDRSMRTCQIQFCLEYKISPSAELVKVFHWGCLIWFIWEFRPLMMDCIFVSQLFLIYFRITNMLLYLVRIWCSNIHNSFFFPFFLPNYWDTDIQAELSVSLFLSFLRQLNKIHICNEMCTLLCIFNFFYEFSPFIFFPTGKKI